MGRKNNWDQVSDLNFEDFWGQGPQNFYGPTWTNHFKPLRCRQSTTAAVTQHQWNTLGTSVAYLNSPEWARDIEGFFNFLYASFNNLWIQPSWTNTRTHTQIKMQTGDATQLDTVDKVGGPINWILSQQTTIGWENNKHMIKNRPDKHRRAKAMLQNHPWRTTCPFHYFFVCLSMAAKHEQIHKRFVDLGDDMELYPPNIHDTLFSPDRNRILGCLILGKGENHPLCTETRRSKWVHPATAIPGISC